MAVSEASSRISAIAIRQNGMAAFNAPRSRYCLQSSFNDHRIDVSELEPALAFYGSLTGLKTDLRFQYPDAELELASVGPFLILAGSEEALAPFRETLPTFRVDSVEAFREHLTKNGAPVIRDVKRVPTGSNMTVQHPDGSRFEYAQHHI